MDVEGLVPPGHVRRSLLLEEGVLLVHGLVGGWLARRYAGRLDVREQLRQLG